MTDKNKSQSSFDPLSDASVDQLIEDMEGDLQDASDTMNNSTAGVIFDMFNPDSWDLHNFALDDIRNYIYHKRKELDLAIESANSGKRGVEYWMKRYEREKNNDTKMIEYWRNKYKQSVGDTTLTV